MPPRPSASTHIQLTLGERATLLANVDPAYLAFIHLYIRLNRRPPAESDIQAYFRTSPPVVHETLNALQAKGFIAREQGIPRSIRLLLQPHEIPELE